MTDETKKSYIEKIQTENSSAPKGCSLSYYELERLAESLSDGTVFGIISELKDIQEIKLSGLRKDRDTLGKTYQDKQKALEKGQADAYDKMLHSDNFLPQHEEAMLKSFKSDSTSLASEEKEVLRKFDLDVLDQLDKQVEDQQKYLDIAGIPFMNITPDRATIKKQMFIISIIEGLPQPPSD